MHRKTITGRRSSIAIVASLILIGARHANAEFDRPVLIKAARVVVAPGETIENGQVLIEKGRIVRVGASIDAPAHAEIFDANDLTVYAGLIDALSHRGLTQSERTAEELKRLADEAPDVLETVQSATIEAYRRLAHPSWHAEEFIDTEKADFAALRNAGLTAALVAPPTANFAGTSAVVQLGDRPLRRLLVATGVAQHAAFVTREADADDAEGGRGRREAGYPSSTMGAIALVRQTLLDARWHRELLAWAERNPGKDLIPVDRDLEALWPALDGKQPVAFSANSEDEIHRALNMAAEFKLRPIIVGGREAWKAAERLANERVPVILSVNWPDAPEIPTGPKNESAEAETQPSGAMSRSDREPSTWKARGPQFDDDWQKRAWISRREFEEKRRLWHEQIDNAARLYEAGVRFAFATYDLESPSELHDRVRKAVKRGLPADAALAAMTTHAADMLNLSKSFGRVAEGQFANLTMTDGPLFEKETKVRWVFVEGRPFRIDEDAKKMRGGRHGRKGEKDKKDDDADESKKHDDEDDSDDAIAKKLDEIDWPEFPCEIDADRKPTIETNGSLLLRNATLLTIENGDLPETDLLVRDGIIAEIGKALAPRPGVVEIDLTGYVVSPGLIDVHSHMCIDGGVNEGTLSVTPEVSIRDVVNHDDVGAFRALVGGVTCIHTMHGSANTIGGQNATLRLRWGEPASEWLFKEAPRTIKFALGENVKQSNWGTRRSRFPATRMGVEAVLRRSFDAAVEYSSAAGGKDAKPKRTDLRLAALSRVLSGDLWVHCHCYRADEVLRLLETAEDYGVRIAVLQHILEGYRIMPEIHRHGCSASTFSDWWAYKIEAFNAIPHNAARMTQAGIVTTVNSDSAELVRHLNLEAAKSLHFGGLSANDAMRLVTLNGAIQLGVSEYVGSIVEGKRADLAVFDGHPLDTFSKCVLTTIDGRVYFQHPEFDSQSPAEPRRIKEFSPPHEPMDLSIDRDAETWLIGATVHPVNGDPIENGYVSIVDGKIVAVGSGEGAPPESANVIEVSGLHIYPGLINAGVQIGLIEIDSVAGTDDQNVLGTFQPDLQALSGYDPFSAMVGVARSEGVLTALVPPNGAVISGQAGVVRLDGWSMPESRLAEGAGLFVALPHLPDELPPRLTEKAKEERTKEYKERLSAVEKYFRDAKAYALSAETGEADKSLRYERDRRFDAMRPYLVGERPVFFRANTYKQIVEAIAFAETHGLRPVIFGGHEAWKLAEELATKKIDVVIVRSMELPRGRFEPFDSVYRNAAMLADAGVRFAFATAEPSLAKQVGIEAGMAVAHGLEESRAIRAVTLDAAAILGLDDRLGSIEPGKVADLIVTTDSPLQASSCVVAAFINGRPIDLSNRHTMLDEKWQGRPEPMLQPEVQNHSPPGPPAMRLQRQ